MQGSIWQAGLAAIAMSLCTLPAGAGAAGRIVQLAQNATDAGGGVTVPNPSPVAGAPSALPVNTPAQIRKAQIELRRLDCLKGPIDGKLGDQTRKAVKDFWASGKQPPVDVNITDELISNLTERGDGFCRPIRRFFGFGGRPGGNFLPLFAPGARPGSGPGMAVRPPTPDATQ